MKVISAPESRYVDPEAVRVDSNRAVTGRVVRVASAIRATHHVVFDILCLVTIIGPVLEDLLGRAPAIKEGIGFNPARSAAPRRIQLYKSSLPVLIPTSVVGTKPFPLIGKPKFASFSQEKRVHCHSPSSPPQDSQVLS